MSATLSQSAPHVAPAAAARTAARTRWASYALSGVPVLLLVLGIAMALSGAAPAVTGMQQYGFAPHLLVPIGLIELACLVLYLVPRTAPLGAVLFTGYFGGAIATHLRLGQPLASQTLVPLYVAVLLWAGLYLRDARVRALLRPAR